VTGVGPLFMAASHAGLYGSRLRALPALLMAMATACWIAFYFVGGWLVPKDPSQIQSFTSVVILQLTVAWLVPLLSGIWNPPPSAESIDCDQMRYRDRIEIRPAPIAPCAHCLFDILRAHIAQARDHAPLIHRLRDANR